MSNNLINGYSDILSRYNLCSNGSFRINQRGNFTSWTPVAVNDYVADCWYVSSINLDYCEVNTTPYGIIYIRGYGKKNQSLTLKNRDLAAFGQNPLDDNVYTALSTLTAAVAVNNTTNSIPIQVSTSPKYYSTYSSTVYESSPKLKSNQVKEAVLCKQTLTDSMNVNSFVTIELMTDGDFNFNIYSFRELAGAFRNPPSFVPVPYADDLQRSERYYQEGSFTGDVYVPFRTKMAGTPSVTLSSGSASSISANGFVTGSSTGVYTWSAEIA